MASTRINNAGVQDAALLVTAGLVLAILGPLPCAAAPRASAMEPPAGALPDGRLMLIDDGTCPSGRIKRIVGGNTRIGKPRLRSCVPRR